MRVRGQRGRDSGIGLLLGASAGLVGAGLVALALSVTGSILPYELRGVGLTRADLCAVADCRVNGFMAHDRAAFGGALVGIGVQYLYLVLGPLRRDQAWAWWLLAVSSSVGVLSFLAFFGSGYIDPWHGAGTLVLGGVTRVFVTEDIAFMGLGAHHLHALDPGLVPLIAHDRISFGAAVVVTGLTTLGHVWFGRLTRTMWTMLLVAGSVALTAAFGTHFAVGYVDTWHLAPPVVAALALLTGLALTYPGGAPPAPAARRA